MVPIMGSLRHHSTGELRTSVRGKNERLDFNYGIVVGGLRTNLLLEEHKISKSPFPLPERGGRVLRGSGAERQRQLPTIDPKSRKARSSTGT